MGVFSRFLNFANGTKSRKASNGAKYSRVDQVKFVEDSL